tara:strand:+ start:3718 stop:4395 length:678 start_codon:yes stop_codon:yes gene_type:complete
MTAEYDQFTALLQGRYSCRAFRPDPVPADVITRIVSAARRVPSWCNAQPWQVAVTTGAATDSFRTALMQAAQSDTPAAPDLAWPTGYSGVHAERRRSCGFQLYGALQIERSDRAARQAQMLRNFALFDAPHVAIVTSGAELGPYGAMDCGGFVTAFTLAATALGVGTVAQAAITAYAPLVRAHLDLPDNRLVLCAISFGYPDDTDPANRFRTERAEVDDIIDWKS